MIKPPGDVILDQEHPAHPEPSRGDESHRGEQGLAELLLPLGLGHQVLGRVVPADPVEWDEIEHDVDAEVVVRMEELLEICKELLLLVD